MFRVNTKGFKRPTCICFELFTVSHMCPVCQGVCKDRETIFTILYIRKIIIIIITIKQRIFVFCIRYTAMFLLVGSDKIQKKTSYFFVFNIIFRSVNDQFYYCRTLDRNRYSIFTFVFFLYEKNVSRFRLG